MNDQLLIAIILVTVIIASANLAIINPVKNTCNDDYCEIDYYKKFKSNPKLNH